MSILYLARNKKRIRKNLGVVFALSFMFMILISSWGPGTALAGSVGDVVTQVSKANTGSPEFKFGQESATGYGFAIHAGMGNYGDGGGCMLSVLGPAQPDEIQIMIDYVDGISQVTYIRTTQMKGCEVREYTTDDGVGIGVVLPDYFITVEMLDTGLNQGANMAAAKSIAQQTLDGLERAGLLSQAAPDIESGKPAADPAPKDSAPATASPAGVGSVGNIPGPSNTTEAVTGVVVPGLIATALGALGGLGGGGFIPPAGGTPIYPTGGGPSPLTGGSYPGAGNARPGAIQGVNQLGGRRRGEEIYVDTGAIGQKAIDIREVEQPADHGMIIDTADMFETPIAVQHEPGVIIDTADEAGIFVQPEPEIYVDTVDMHEQAIDIREPGGEAGIHIDTTDMFEESPVPGAIDEKRIFIETEDEAALFTKSGSDLEIEAEPVKTQAFSAREGEAGGAHFATAENSEGAPAAAQSEHLYTDAGDSEVPLDTSSLEDSTGAETVPGSEEAATAAGAEGQSAEQTTVADVDKIYDQNGFDPEGYNREGFDKEGFDRQGFDRQGFDKDGFDRAGFNAEGFDKEGFNKAGFDKAGFNREGFDKTGFDKEGFDKSGFDREGFDKAGFNAEGFDREGFNKAGFDKEGYGRNGFGSEGFDREGYDVNGYDRKGFNRSGFDAKGYDKQGYDKEGFNKDGWDREGYDHKGFDENGWDREGYDKNGFDKEGYDREGYNREGQSKEGYDADGYDKKGFNEHGYDRDGYDREGFDFEGYSRSGYDPWGYNRQGYDKDGYHWSGYNADGYNRAGMHWTDNPYEEGSIWNVDTYNPFDGRVVDLGGRREAWEPTKPPLGEPYHRTVEKYGAKPWTDEIPQSTPEKPTIPLTEDAGVIGPEDSMNTLKNHGIDQDAPTAPEGQTGTGLSIPEEDIPDAGNVPPDTIPDVPPVSGPQHGDTITLPGKDGRDYELEYNSQTGEWENLLTGGRIRNEDLGSYVEDFNRWQDDVAEDLSRSARDIEKMAARQDATSQAIDKNLADWKRLEQMQKMADKYNIGEPGGSGDVDKAIQNLKDDMLAGKELDQDRLEQLNKIIDNRIQGTTAADTGQRWEEDWFKNLGWALEANAATAKEVVTGEKADGSTSWLGMGARIMITTATGGTAGVVMDGGLTVAEAMYRIKDSIDKGESDFRAVSKAIGLTVLGEEAGWLAGEAGGKLMGEMMERYPAFTNKAADLIETAILKGSAKNQMWSKSLGLISKESAEETLDQINKRLVDIGSGEAAENIIKKARGGYGLSVADSFDDVSKAGKAFTGSGDDILKGGKSASEGWSDIAADGGKSVSDMGDDMGKGASRAASGSGDDIARGTGKAASGSSDDVAKGAGKVASSSDDLAKGGSKAGSRAGDGPDGPVRTGDGGGDGPGTPGGPPSRGGGGDAGSMHPEAINNRTLNTNARTPEEVLSDPTSVARAEQSLQKNIKDFDKLPPTRQQDLIREQAIYDEYKMQAQERTYNVADKVERREPLTVEDIMEMKADPASMRTLKDLENVDGIGAELGPTRSRQVQSEFNHVLDTEIHQPSYRTVEEHLHSRYPGTDPEGIRCRTVRTPGTECNAFDINTDNDVIAERLVHGPNGPEWVEIPKSEWEDVYYKAFADKSGFSVDEATRRFPDSDWAKMDDATRFREWAGRHEESAMDQFDLEAARDFSDQRTWRIQDGDLPGRPMIEATPEEIARGADIVMIDGRPMRPSSGYELVQRRQGNLLDSEQLSIMESYKVDEYWTAGSTPAEVMRNQTEAMEQLRKTANVAQTVESSYRDMGYRIEQMPNNMQEAIKVINNNSLSPAARAARLRELGYETPGDFLNKVTSRIGAIREAKMK